MNKNLENNKDDVVNISSFMPLKIDYFFDKYSSWEFETFIWDLYIYFQKEIKKWKSGQEMIDLLYDFKTELINKELEIERSRNFFVKNIYLILNNKINKFKLINENKVKIRKHLSFLVRYFDLYRHENLTMLELLEVFDYTPIWLEKLVKNLEFRRYLNEIKISWDLQREMIRNKNKKWNISKRESNVVFVNFK